MHRTLSRGDKVFPALLAKAHWLANSLHSASPRCAQACKPSQKGGAFAGANAVRLDCAARRRINGFFASESAFFPLWLAEQRSSSGRAVCQNRAS